MGRVKEVVSEIEQLWVSGLDAPAIAKIVNMPLDWVQEVVDDYIIENEEMNRQNYSGDFDDVQW